VACEDNALLLHAYSDGELDLVRSLEIEKHVKICASCAHFEGGHPLGESLPSCAGGPTGANYRV